MLDEPFAGIDPVTVQSIQGVITQLRDSGISVLITDHAAREILTTVDRCYVIYQGQVLIDGTPAEVKQHPKVREEYLGDLDAAAGVPTPAENSQKVSNHPSERIDNGHEAVRAPQRIPVQKPRRIRVTDV